MNIRIFPPDGMLEASVDLPLSKSMSARALIINHIGGFAYPHALSESEDTQTLLRCIDQKHGTINIGPSGTSMRFLTALYSATDGTDIVIEGDERMHQRPIGPLVDALHALGADITYIGSEGYPPLHIRGKKLSGGEIEIEIDASISSQFLSALMMVAPLMDNSLSLKFDGEPTSLPYIHMTSSMMQMAGVEPEFMYNRIEIPNTPYTHPIAEVERDWSAASYWYAITAISAGWVTLNDMTLSSCQGDNAMRTFGERLGVITSESEEVEGALELSASPDQFSRIDADMSGHPDLVPAIVVAALALGMPFRLTGVHTLRNKESDRLEALQAEALKLGLILDIESDNVLSWEGKRVPVTTMPHINPHGDHRIAMSFAPLAIFLPGLVIEDCDVVRKSYPDFWNHLEQAGFVLMDGDAPVELKEDNE